MDVALNNKLIALAAQSEGFLRCDEIISVSEEAISARYRFKPDEPFYPGHFPGNPVTPGVILIECLKQIGLLCHGLFLEGADSTMIPLVCDLIAVKFDVMKPVLPGDEVTVMSALESRSQRMLTCQATMHCLGQQVAEATLSGNLRNLHA